MVGGGDGAHDNRNFHPEGEAFVTMVTSDDFVIGAETMFHSLRDHCNKNNKNQKEARQRALVVMVTPGVSELKRQALNAATDHVIEVSNSNGAQIETRDCHLGRSAAVNLNCMKPAMFSFA